MGEGTETQIARLDERDKALLARLNRIEDKIDKLIPTVAKIGGSTALVISVGVYAVAAAMFG